MKASVVFVCCLLGIALAQPQAPGNLGVNKHLVELNQAHLPKDANNLAATQQFLLEFARLKALSDAAPKIQTHEQFPQAQAAPIQQQPRQQVQRQPVQLQQQQQHRFAAPVRTQAPVRKQAPVRTQAPIQAPRAPTQAPRAPTQAPRAPTASFDINSAIGKLLQSVQSRNPSTSQAPLRAAAPVPFSQQSSATLAGQQAGFRQQAPRQQAPRQQVFSQQAPRQQVFRQQAPRPTISQGMVIPINNAQGLVINPKQFNGPLAHSLPAAVNGPVQHTQFTPEVAAAHQALAAAHRSIIQQQIALQPQQQRI